LIVRTLRAPEVGYPNTF